MTRYSKGTTDHDGDGKMGGSRKRKAEKAEKLDEQFAEADEKADIAAQNTLQRAVRGY